MTSWAAARGNSHKHIYTAAKGAVVSLTRALAGEHAKDGVRVNAIAPAVVRTERSNRNYQALAEDATPRAQARFELAKSYPFSVGEPEHIAGTALMVLLATGGLARTAAASRGCSAPTRRPQVATVHDVLPITRPELYPPGTERAQRSEEEARSAVAEERAHLPAEPTVNVVSSAPLRGPFTVTERSISGTPSTSSATTGRR